jgi:hypothetical protein
VETLREPPRLVQNMLSRVKVKCLFCDSGEKVFFFFFFFFFCVVCLAHDDHLRLGMCSCVLASHFRVFWLFLFCWLFGFVMLVFRVVL